MNQAVRKRNKWWLSPLTSVSKKPVKKPTVVKKKVIAKKTKTELAPQKKELEKTPFLSVTTQNKPSWFARLWQLLF